MTTVTSCGLTHLIDDHSDFLAADYILLHNSRCNTVRILGKLQLVN